MLEIFDQSTHGFILFKYTPRGYFSITGMCPSLSTKLQAMARHVATWTVHLEWLQFEQIGWSSDFNQKPPNLGEGEHGDKGWTKSVSSLILFRQRLQSCKYLWTLRKNDRYDLFKDMQSHLLGNLPLILAGDFNCVLKKEYRKRAGEEFKTDKTSLFLKNIIQDFSLTDTFKSMHPGELGHTWASSDGTKASRINYIFTRDLMSLDARLTPLFISDHAMLSCTLSLPSGVTIGRGL